MGGKKWKTNGNREIMREMAMEKTVEKGNGFPRLCTEVFFSTAAVERIMGIMGKTYLLELMFSVMSLMA